MNDWVIKLGATVILILAAVTAYGKLGPGIPIASVVTQKQDLFTVTGEGKVTVVPDMAVVDVGISSNQATVAAAQNQANTVINQVTTKIKELGVDPKDIKTTSYSIYPQYDYRESGSANRIIGYQVNVSLTIRVRDIDKVNAVIDGATAAGANTVGGMQLTVDEKREKELLQQAREEAVKEAKAKAESLAQAAGITLGKIVNVQEAGTGGPIPVFAKEAIGAGRGEPTNIQPGSTDITSAVTLYYETR